MSGTKLAWGTLAFAAAFACAASASAQDNVAQFYRDQQIKMIVGSAPGGGYDTYARLVARHIGKHIPGHPTIITQNMDGAGGIVAANYMVNVAPKDGTVIGSLQREVALAQIMGQPGPQYEADKLFWLGSLSTENGVCAVATRSNITSIEDFFTKQIILGSTGPNTTEFHPALLATLLGAKIKLIKGYPGTSHLHLAIQRGEIDGVCQSWSSFKELAGDFYAKGSIKPVIQMSLQPDAEMDKLGVPMLWPHITPEHVKGYNVDEVRTFFRLAMAPNLMGRPFAMAPGVPTDRLKALRAAFVATVKDPEFVAEAEKMRRDIEFVDGEEIQTVIADLARTPKKNLAALDDLMKFAGPSDRAKLELVRHTGKVLETKDDGRAVVIDYQGKKTSANVSGSRTKVAIDGAAAKGNQVMAGMTCTFVYYGPNTDAQEVDCKK